MLKRVIWAGLGLGAIGVGALVLKPGRLPVEVGVVLEGPLVVTVDEEGRTRVRDRYLVSAPVAGRLARIVLREGDVVRRGSVVARIAPAPLDARGQDVAAARLQAALASARAATAALDQTEAALAQAQRDRERVEELARQGMAPPERLEQVRLAETTRRKEVDAARYRSQAAAQEVRVAQAGLTGADPEEDCPDVIQLTSPIDGRVLRVPEPSERVVTAGTPVLEIGDPAGIEVVADVLSSDAVRLHSGDRVFIDEWGGDSALTGRIRTIEPSGFTKLSALGVEEQRVRVIITPDGRAPIGDGFRVEVRIVVWETGRAIQVPVGSLYRLGPAWSVFTVRGGRAYQRPVQVGHRNPFHAEVLGGVAAGDTVVIHPTDQLSEGARVHPM